jgi:hypothetical protein
LPRIAVGVASFTTVTDVNEQIVAFPGSLNSNLVNTRRTTMKVTLYGAAGDEVTGSAFLGTMPICKE